MCRKLLALATLVIAGVLGSSGAAFADNGVDLTRPLIGATPGDVKGGWVAPMTASVTADPTPQACPGELVSFAVKSLGGRRAVADAFFGDHPRAVQDAQGFMEQFCGVGPA